jgi:hypothetical protein
MITGQGALPQSDFTRAGMSVQTPRKKVVFANPVTPHKGVFVRSTSSVGTRFTMALPNFDMSFGKLKGTPSAVKRKPQAVGMKMKPLDIKMPNFDMSSVLIGKKKKGKK